MLSIQNLTVKISNKIILKNISTTFRSGKIYAIMGVNGSGKSTLVKAIMGNHTFKVSQKSRITLNNKSIKNLAIEKRATQGIFVSMQAPPEIPGVTVKQLLRATTKNKKIAATDLLEKIGVYAKKLKISDDLLNRSLNDGFSGGERKKMELLQMAILDPKYIFLDEIDTGVDVDAIKTISNFLKKFIKDTNKTLIIISHQNKIFKQLQPDQVLIMKSGKIAKKGDSSLIKKVEVKGYENL